MTTRRQALQFIVGGAAFTVGIGGPAAAESRIPRLIVEARAQGDLSQRIDFISHALLNTKYRGYTLIGGPKRAERMVTRDDAFDCVTYCETVLAAALSREPADFEPALRAIRYYKGEVTWRTRNHYFADWGEHNIDNKTCRAVTMDGTVELQKTLYWHREFGRRSVHVTAIPQATFLANKAMLERGDIVGFVTRRPNLDYFHVGFVVFDRNGELMLRHASQSRGRVLDDRMQAFIAQTGARYVTVWRPQDHDKAA